MEEELVLKKGIDFIPISTAPFAGKSVLTVIKSFFILLKGIVQSILYLNKYKPDYVISMGGYVGTPVIIAAYLKRIKRYIVEQDSRVGLSTRKLYPILTKLFVTYKELEKKYDNAEYIPHIIDRRIEQARISKGEDKTILVFGGSLGSSYINEITDKIIRKMKEFHFVWITGKRDYMQYKNNVYENAVVYDFSDKMYELYGKAQLVISRSGAITLAEIMTVAKPAILIPYPYAANNEQYYNAIELENKGIAIVMEEKILNEQTLENTIKRFYNTGDILKMREKALSFKRENGLDYIIKELYSE